MKKVFGMVALAAFLGVSTVPAFAVVETNKIVHVMNDEDPKKKNNKETKENKDQKSEGSEQKSSSCCEKSKECTDEK